MDQGLFQKRLKKAQVIATLLSLVPFVRMVGLNGSMTRGTIKKASDIDFLIFTKHGRIWTARFLVTVFTHLTGQRRYGNKVAGRICLNRYQTDRFLEIKPHNEYSARVYSSLCPLYQANPRIYQEFQKANQWMEEFGFKVKPAYKITGRHFKTFSLIQKTGELLLSGYIGNVLEKFLRRYQKQRILKDKRTYEAPAGSVRVSDWELCFHPRK